MDKKERDGYVTAIVVIVIIVVLSFSFGLSVGGWLF